MPFFAERIYDYSRAAATLGQGFIIGIIIFSQKV